MSARRKVERNATRAARARTAAMQRKLARALGQGSTSWVQTYWAKITEMAKDLDGDLVEAANQLLVMQRKARAVRAIAPRALR